ncbi:MAG: hypothetical protein V2J89_08655, partial [Halieaceae bacterium]|nr:hypothetical protein [Halieaceae bacterium]
AVANLVAKAVAAIERYNVVGVGIMTPVLRVPHGHPFLLFDFNSKRETKANATGNWHKFVHLY